MDELQTKFLKRQSELFLELEYMDIIDAVRIYSPRSNLLTGPKIIYKPVLDKVLLPYIEDYVFTHDNYHMEYDSWDYEQCIKPLIQYCKEILVENLDYIENEVALSSEGQEKLFASYTEVDSVESLVKIAGAKSISELEEALVKNSEYSDDPADAKKPFNKIQWAELLAADPTYEGGEKVGSYILWLIRTFKNQPEKITEDGYKAKEYLTVFHQVKNRLPQEQKRIENYTSLPELYQLVAPYLNNEEDMQSEGQKKRELYQEKDNIYTAFDDENWMVVVPNSYGASCYWGSNTQWCTATRENDKYFNSYFRSGDLYIFINKQNPEEKYQYHNDGQYESFMDSSDDSVSMREFIDNLEDQELKRYLQNEFMYDVLETVNQKKFEYLDTELDRTFESEAKYELRRFEENGEIPQDVLDLARQRAYDTFYEDSSNITVGQSLYIDWDDIEDFIKERLPEYRAENKLNAETSEGQQFLFNDDNEPIDYSKIASLYSLVTSQR